VVTSEQRAGALLSVNVGMPRDVTWQGRTVHTAVWKKPAAGPAMVRRLNIDGDGQGDLAGHGGEQRAVFVYQIESYRYWQDQLGRDDFSYGQFGENFTVQGLADDQVCIGDRYQIGGAVFEVTQPRVTCFRVGIRMDDPQMPALLVSHHRPGFYFRVLTEGAVAAGQQIIKVASGPEAMTVAETDALLYLPGHPRQQLRRALRIPALSAGWKTSFTEMLDQPGQAGGNAGLAEASPPPAWPGFRPLAVTAISRESDTVISVHLADPGGGSVPGGLCTIPVGRQVRDRDALQLGDLTEPGRSAEAGPGRAQHDDTAVARIAHPLGEAERLDQPVHCRAGVGVQKIGNDLRIWIVLWHGSNFTAGPAGGLLAAATTSLLLARLARLRPDVVLAGGL
jgi:MOSC domain-containing protein YiiM